MLTPYQTAGYLIVLAFTSLSFVAIGRELDGAAPVGHLTPVETVSFQDDEAMVIEVPAVQIP